MTFNELNLSQPILKAISKIGFSEPTEIQAKCIPELLSKKDVVGQSMTGSGKTFAFGIPAIESIDQNINEIQALILCPTRELAIQITDELRKLTSYNHSIGIAPVYGGHNMAKQIMSIKKSKIVVGTPGRILDHMHRKTLKLNSISFVVLDEADEMLNMGFRHDIETILKATPRNNKTTAMFSATMPVAIKSLMVTHMHSPVFIETSKSTTTQEEIDETFLRTIPGGKKQAVLELLNKLHPQSAIVFCNTRQMVDSLTRFLISHSIDAKAIHGDRTQSERKRTMDLMKAHNLTILVATDVAARGIDIDSVEYIINFDIPNDFELYTHRIGRTGRAGKKGVSISIVDDAEKLDTLTAIIKSRKTTLREHELSTTLSTFSDIVSTKNSPKSAMHGGGPYNAKSKTFIPFMKSNSRRKLR
ncbi:MAG: DEAD/DEAH box helicase [Christensenellaceae bacterium]|jgi:ATP-dependent RNA helicase DeaD|nr:DEAD/DEAH box helicase [Christensenellaceae bacterium]